MPSDPSSPDSAPQIDPAELETTLRVLAALSDLDENDPDFDTVRRATAKMFKSVKVTRRAEKRRVIADADRQVIAATATGAPTRIDDETRGADLVSGTDARTAGELQVARPCYICKERYTLVDSFYHQLCPSCAAMSHAKRDARTDLTGKRALLTGGRAKIGMYIALRLLRDGAHTTITTRFPRDAARRFAAMPDSADWLHRVRIVGIDLRDPAQVIALADDVAAQGPLDILINNAAQTVRRSPGAYSPLVDAESSPLPDGPLPEIVSFGHTNDAHPLALADSVASHPILSSGLFAGTMTADDLTALALAPGSSSLARLADRTAIDAGGLVPDLHHTNSWVGERRRRRPARDARGAALQHHGAVHPRQPAAPVAGRQRGPAHATSSTCRRWRASSVAATRVPGIRTPTWPRRPSTCSPAPAPRRCSPTASS